MAKTKYDFGGWATKANILCSDGRTIMPNAFADNDGKVVPLVWNHQHNSPDNILGHALLKNCSDGVYAYCSFNDTAKGTMAKTLVEHGDISALSIFANQLKQQAGNVLHGMIREVSLVLAGANKGACIDYVMSHCDENGIIVLCHADSSSEEAIIYNDDFDESLVLDVELEHADNPESEPDNNSDSEPSSNPEEQDVKSSVAEDLEHADDSKEETGDVEVGDVIDSMTDVQKQVLYMLVGMAKEDANTETNENDKGENNMKHNAFESQSQVETNVLCHSDEVAILNLAKEKNVGSLKQAMQVYLEENSEALAHGDVSGFDDASISSLLPEYKDIRGGEPELVTNDQTWVNNVMAKVQKVPFKRIRTSVVDIREVDGLTAKGYVKGHKKALTGTYSLVRRTADPQTVYVKSALNRDDILDLEDFDTVSWQYKVDLLSLKETLAVATLLGDGREAGDDDKIYEEHIHPIWTDDELFTIHKDIDLAAEKAKLQGSDTSKYFGDEFIFSETISDTLAYTRKDFRGTGKADFYCTPETHTKMLLARDRDGHRLYKTDAELATALNVANVFEVTQFSNKVRTAKDGSKHELLGIYVNISDYAYGATKKDDVAHFTDFDIDFNQQKSLLETRKSGMLTRIKSAIVLEQKVDVAG